MSGGERLISLFLPSVHGGGAERAMLVFAREVLNRGYRVDLVTATYEGALKAIIPDGVRVVNFGTRRLSHGLFKLARYLRVTRPHVMYSTITHANVLAASARRLAGGDTRIIVRQSNVPISEPKLTWRRRITFRAIPRAYSWTDGIIAVSDGVARELTMLDPRLSSLVKVIATPVVSDDVLQQGEAPVDHPWFAEGEPPVILGAGRLKLHKGFLTLIRAFAKVRTRTGARLMIIGEGSDRPILEEEIQRLGLQSQVSLPGFQTNPFGFMNRAKAFVLSSEYEGLPNVLIQAMAFGTPVVSTDCKSGPSEILEQGRLGQLVPIGDVNALAGAIERAVELPKQERTQQVVLERYGAANAARAYLAMGGL